MALFSVFNDEPHIFQSVLDEIFDHNRLFDDKIGVYYRNNGKGNNNTKTNNNCKSFSQKRSQCFMMATDLTESVDQYQYDIEVAGVALENVDVSIGEDNQLMVSIDRPERSGEDAKDVKWLVKERSNGKQKRNFDIPKNVDVSKISVHLSNGVLSIKLPKTAESSSTVKKLKIETS